MLPPRHQTKHKLTTGLLAMSLFVGTLSSCSEMTDRTKTIGQGTAIGTAAGAATGAAFGQLIGRSTKATVIGTSIGTAFGSLIGYAYGTSVANTKAQYATKEAELQNLCNLLDSRIQIVQQNNQKLTREIATLKRNKTKLSAFQAKQYENRINSNLSLIDTDLQAAKASHSMANSAEKQALDARIRELEKERKRLNSNMQDLSQLSII